jgi:signal transduction histidine kinase
MPRSLSVSGTPTRVLVVEDDPHGARLVEAVLGKAQSGRFSVSCAPTLAAALEQLAVGQTDAVLLDLGLPDSEGLGTLFSLRERAPETAIVVLTGAGDEELGLRALRAGAQDYLIKGETGAALLARSVLYAIERARAAAEIRRLEGQVVQAVEAEQRRLGRDLHDSLGQQLTGIQLIIGAVAKRLATRAVPEAADAGTAARLLEVAIGDVRSLARGLCPTVQGGGLGDALAALARATAATHGIACHCYCDFLGSLDDATSTDLYRIAQEAINNAVRHGKAKTALLRLAAAGGQLTLTIEDDGGGIPDPQPPTAGMGISTMRYRARMIGGELTVRRAPTGGTIVACSLPYPQA